MAEETKDPARTFPKIMIIGLCATGAIYVLVSVTAVALVPLDELSEGDTPLLKVVEAGPPGLALGTVFPFIAMFAVANSALLNMLMASRLLYGMAREVLPPVLGKVHPGLRNPYVAIGFTTPLAVGLITFVGNVPDLGGTTALLLLAVFTVVNVAVLVLRKDDVGHEHFRTPTALPVVGALACGYLVTPLSGRDVVQYQIAGVLLVLGVVLWA